MESGSAKKYIDAKEGAARLMGNATLYKKLLKNFLENKHVETLQNNIESNDFDAALKSAHAIKGVCANLSLPELYELSLSLEQSFKDGVDHKDIYSRFNSAYEETVKSINEVIENL